MYVYCSLFGFYLANVNVWDGIYKINILCLSVYSVMIVMIVAIVPADFLQEIDQMGVLPDVE